VNGEGNLDDGKKLNAVLQSEHNHVVYQPRLRDDVRTYSGDVSQIAQVALLLEWQASGKRG
jgi:hypothetical protein